MNVATRIVRKELLESSRDGRVRWACGIVLAILLISLASGWQQYRTDKRLRDDARVATRQAWLRQTPKNPHSAAHYGIYAFKPTLPLSFVDRGVDAYAGVTAFLEAHRQNGFGARAAQDATSIGRFGEWSAAAVLQVLVPLVIVLLGFSSITAERESGTLRQLLCAGVAPRGIILGKASAIAAVVGVVGIPAAATGGLSLALHSGADGDLMARAAGLALVYGGYFLVFALITLAVSAFAPSSRVALIALLAFWAANTLLAPRVLADFARLARPAPATFTFNRDLEHALAEGAPNAEGVASHVAKTGSFRKLNMRGFALEEGERHGDAIFDARYGNLHDTYESQNTVQKAGAILVPLTAVRFLSMALAGTDEQQHWSFAEAAERYRRVFVHRMSFAIAYDTTTPDDKVVMGDSKLWSSVLPFSYQLPGVSAALVQQRGALLTLLLWIAGAAFVAHLSVKRLTPNVVREA